MPALSRRALRGLAPLLLAAAASSACVSVAATTASPAPAAVADTAFPSIRWVRSSAEHRAIFLQTYRLATEELERRAAGRAAGSWAVILDADETVLDNSEYQRRRALVDSAFTAESWRRWVAERAAPALPGAAAFVQKVRSLGGRIAIVTNRNMDECDDTRANLASAGLPADVVLCRPPETGDKNPRFQAVERGTASSGLPPLAVVMYVGDNIQDFPGMTQAVREAAPAALAPFGRNWFMLPNPMYGSWERNPDR